MMIIRGRNVQDILPVAVSLLVSKGQERDSRNGPVLQAPGPVTTVYEAPNERVLFYPERDANPFFHLYEMLWMIAGRNDLAGPQRYVKSFGEFSDDGVTLHGAYGHRWRHAFSRNSVVLEEIDQLKGIAAILIKNNLDRRAVLQMWDTELDLGKEGKDLPCNDTATLQIGPDGRLHLVVFCRSNDIVWGCYGANAVHFSFLLEYMAHWIGVPVGTYTQVSVNWHGYLKTLDSVRTLKPMNNPYADQLCSPVSLDTPIELTDDYIASILDAADTGFKTTKSFSSKWATVFYNVLRAHHLFKTESKQSALISLERNDFGSDWELAAAQWLMRRGNKK